MNHLASQRIAARPFEDSGRASRNGENSASVTPFLTAQWRHLAMLNFEVDPDVLQPYVPAGTELDDWCGRILISVVGFRFLDTRVCGWSIPFHRNFDEVNLRFYVRRKNNGAWRRGVVFVKELAPRRAIAWVARAVYGENYVVLPLSHQIHEGQREKADELNVSYHWRFLGRENFVRVSVRGEPRKIEAGSEEEFITEHYWGYTRRRKGPSLEYQVAHPAWRVWSANESQLDCDVVRLYGRQFAESLQAPPSSAFLVDGSEVTVFQRRSLVLSQG